MTIRVKYFASLRERMGRAEDALPAAQTSSVLDIWHAVSDGAPLPANVLAAVNQEYVSREHLVRDGDEVAFFPPVTGG